MPFVSTVGDVCHGVGGGWASVNNQAFDRGGVCGWLDAGRVGYINGNDGWQATIYDIRTGQRQRVGGVCNSGFAGGGHMAWFAAFPEGAENEERNGLFSTTGLRLPHAGLCTMGPDAAIAYRPLYHSDGPTHVMELDGTEWVLTDTAPAYIHLLGQRRVMWTAFGGRVVAVNMPDPIYTLDGGLWKFQAAEAGGRWWGAYFSGTHGVVLHPFDSFEGYAVAPQGDAWHDIRAISPTAIRVAISRGEGEQPGDIYVRDYDVVSNLIRDPWASLTWQPAERVDIRTINVDYDVPAVNRTVWAGFFTGGSLPGGGWTTGIDPHSVPGNCFLAVQEDGRLYSKADQWLGAFITGKTVDEIEHLARQTPHPIAYWDGRQWPRQPDLPQGAWQGIQAYRGRTEDLDHFEQDVRRQVETARHAVALVCQCYTSNVTLTNDLRALVPVFARLTRDLPQIACVLVFSGSGRATGLQDHPEVLPSWQSFMSTITTPREATLVEPVVTVKNWTLDSLHDGEEFVFFDPKNPDLDYQFRVWVEGGGMYAEIRNRAGQATTGLYRPVRPCDK